MNPPELKYSDEHEWVRLDSDNVAIIGITESIETRFVGVDGGIHIVAMQ